MSANEPEKVSFCCLSSQRISSPENEWKRKINARKVNGGTSLSAYRIGSRCQSVAIIYGLLENLYSHIYSCNRTEFAIKIFTVLSEMNGNGWWASWLGTSCTFRECTWRVRKCTVYSQWSGGLLAPFTRLTLYHPTAIFTWNCTARRRLCFTFASSLQLLLTIDMAV